MKKKIEGAIALFLSLLIVGCGSTNHIDLQDSSDKPIEVETTNEEEIEESKVEENVKAKEEQEENETEIVLKIISTYSAEEYVQKLQNEDPEGYYAVYNDDFYCTRISESERRANLETFTDTEFMESILSEIYTDEVLADAIKSMDYDDNYQHFTFYVDKEKYESNEFIVSLGVGITISAISDAYQAYNLILPDDRITEVTYVDAETRETLNN